jgi:acyl-CoA dehydrogenase
MQHDDTTLREQLQQFMDDHVYPAETRYYQEQSEAGTPWFVSEVVEELKTRARAARLWNLFLPDTEHGRGLNNERYAPLCEIMGRSPIGPEVFNCAAPDTGNMEILHMFGTAEQKRRWLDPLLTGEIRSGFAMTEPAVASSDATNIQASIRRDGDHYVINARKWWTSGAGDPRCKILILMGKTDPEESRYRQQSQVLVPMDCDGVHVRRHLNVFGYTDGPKGHMEIDFKDVRVPVDNVLLGEGRGFEIAQARLGPGRIHHCMRQIGVAERALSAMCHRAGSREAFGHRLAEHGTVMDAIARSRIDIEQARALVMETARAVDEIGGRGARAQVAMIKVAVPCMTQTVLDRAIQIHGGGGVCDDFGLAKAWAAARTLRLADGPDDVHLRTIARDELAKPSAPWIGRTGVPDPAGDG